MTLYIARHGQTDWNASRRYQARTDVPMNDTGRAQALALRGRFDELGLRFVNTYSSPLQRATETARLLTQGSDTEMLVEPTFVEIDLGEWEGLYEKEIKAKVGEAAYDAWRDGGYVKGAPGGESMFDVMDRVRPRVVEIAARAHDTDLLIVAHQATNMAIKAVLSGDTSAKALAQYRQANDEVDVWHQTEKRVERIKVS